MNLNWMNYVSINMIQFLSVNVQSLLAFLNFWTIQTTYLVHLLFGVFIATKNSKHLMNSLRELIYKPINGTTLYSFFDKTLHCPN